MAPARAIKAAMGDVDKAFRKTQQTLAAPSSKRGALSDWEKMVGGAKKSQAADFAKQQQTIAKKQMATQQKLAQFHADHGIPAMLAEGGSEMAVGATVAIAAAAAAAAAAVGYMGFKFAEASVEAGIFAQKSELAIGFLTDNAPQAAQQFDDVRHMAQGLGLQVNETVGSFERLLAMQFSVGKSKDLIKMAADMQAIGASGEEVQRILYAISEIKSMGTLQKRQERMLQMAGISGQLIDAALQKNMGLKDHGALEKARKGNKIGADVAIDSIMEAVMHKTHESALGESGTAFANQTLTGLGAQMHAQLDNLFTDVGVMLLPGVTKIASLFSDIFTAVMNDPKINNVGAFLLDEFNKFTDWVDNNWGAIVSTVVTGAELIVQTFGIVASMLDMGTWQGKVTIGVLGALAAALGIVAVAGFTAMLPLYMLIGAIGLLAYAIIAAVQMVVDAIKKLSPSGNAALSGAATGALSAIPGLGGIAALLGAGIPALSPANDNAAIQGATAAGGTQALHAMNDKTEAGQESGGSPVHIQSLSVTVPQADDPQKQATLIGQAVHTEVAKLIRQAV